jgi:hypothetical protein
MCAGSGQFGQRTAAAAKCGGMDSARLVRAVRDFDSCTARQAARGAAGTTFSFNEGV